MCKLKKLTVGFVFVLLFLFSGTMFASCDKPKDPNYDLSVDKVYAIVQENGYDGTYEQFLSAIRGESGVGITKIEKTGTSELVDTYTIYYTNNTTSTFTITNGNNGEDGNGISSIIKDGAQILEGRNLQKYTIVYTNGSTFDFFVTDGKDGNNGQDGKDGVGIKSVEKLSTNGNQDTYCITFTNNGTTTFTVTNGVDGENGKDGRGIKVIARTSSAGLVDTYTITYSDDTYTTFTVTNGKDGNNGQDGKDGVGIKSVERLSTNGNQDTYIITFTNNETTTFTVTNGVDGENGKDGRGIKVIAKTSSAGLVDTYTITYTDDTYTTFTVTNGKDGNNGQDGKDGVSIENIVVDENGKLVVQLTNKSVINLGKIVGENGNDGNGIEKIEKINSEGLIDTYQITFTNGDVFSYTIQNGKDGENGKDGIGIASILQTSKDGNIDVYTITYTDGSTSTFNVVNGKDGNVGAEGNGIAKIEKTSSNKNVDTYIITFTNNKTTTFTVTNGVDGENGKDGRGIKIIAKTSSAGLIDTYTITYTDDTFTTYTVTNGANGLSAYEIYKLYNPDYTKTEQEWIIDLVNGDLSVKTYTVTFDSDGGSLVKKQEGIKYAGKATKPTDPRKDGYKFEGWYYQDEKWSFIGYSVTENITLIAKWTPLANTITLDADGGILQENTLTVYYNQEYVLPIPTKIGYKFINWFNGEKEFSNGVWLGENDIILTAKWELINYTATFMAGNEKITDLKYTVIDDELTNVPEVPNKEGYIANWEEYILKAENITINAIYTPIEYSIIYELNGGSNSISNPNFYTIEDNIALFNPAKIGYNFLGWFLDGEFKKQITKIERGFTGNLNLYAKWSEAIVYTIVYHLDNGINSKYNPTNYTVESNDIILQNPERGGYVFDGWYLDSQNTISIYYIAQGNYSRNLNIYAKWKAMQFNVNYYINDELILSELVSFDGNYTLKANINVDSMEVVAWQFNDVEFMPNSIITYNYLSDINLYAKLEVVENLNEYSYQLNGTDVTLTKYNGTATNIKIPKYVKMDNSYYTVTKLKDTFSHNSYIVSVEIHNLITDIDDYAFYYCSKLKEVAFEEGSNVTGIGYNAFGYCQALTNIEIPSSVNKIDGAAFYQSGNIVGVFYDGTIKDWCGIEFADVSSNPVSGDIANFYMLNPDGNKTHNNKKYSLLTEVRIPEDIAKVGKYQFYNFDKVINIVIPKNVINIDDYSFARCANLIGVQFESESNLSTIGQYAFEYCTDLVNLNLSGCLTSIGNYAFRGCESVMNVEISKNVASLGYEMFTDCSNLINVYYQGTIQDWFNIDIQSSYANPMAYASKFYMIDEAGSVLYNNKSYSLITNITVPSGITNLRYQLYGFDCLTNIKIPSSVLAIENYAFYQLEKLTSVEFEGEPQIETIGNYSFNYCKSLETINIPASVTNIGDYAFKNCEGLISVTLDNNTELISIGESVFEGCKKLEEFFIPNTVTKIGSSAFYGCESLNHVTFENGSQITSIERLFSGCINLEMVNFGENSLLAIIGEYTFSGCDNLVEVNLPSGIQMIKTNAFYSCRALTSVVVPFGITNIQANAFVSCSSLSNIFFNGSMQQWNGVAISETNSQLNNATVYFFSEEEPVEIGNYWHYVDGVATKW